MIFSQKLLRRILGALWLIDAIFQVQPQMFTSNMINSVLLPTLGSQPAPVAASLNIIILTITRNLVFFNLLIAVVQAEIGLFLIAGLLVRETIILSIVWSVVVWYGGEGMSMLLTGQASVLTGAPGAVLLYPLLGLLVYPRSTSSEEKKGAWRGSLLSLLSQERFHWVLGGFWIFAALLQLQPFWWQRGQISQTIGEMTSLGGFNSILVDPVLRPLSVLTRSLEIPLNIMLIVLFLGLGIGLMLSPLHWRRPLLVLSLLLSLAIWWFTQAFGMIFTGMATDFNSGLLIVLMTLACWPKAPARNAKQATLNPTADLSAGPTQVARSAIS